MRQSLLTCARSRGELATVRKHRSNWVADYRDQYGKRHRERPEGRFENMALQRVAAQALLARRLEEIDRLSYQPKSERLTFDQACDQYLASRVNVRPSTARSYRQLIDAYLRPYFGKRRLHQVSPTDVEAFRTALTQGYPPPIAEAFAARRMAANPRLSHARAKSRLSNEKPGIRTINKCLTLLVMLFNYAARHRWVEFNPAEHVEKVRGPRICDATPMDSNVLAPAEVKRFLDAADSGRRDREGKLITNNYRLVFELAVLTGMRQGEILGAQWGDIDWNSSQLLVRRSWKEGAFHDPKTRSSQRRIDLPSTLLRSLREWRLACPKGEHDLIVPNLDGNPMSHANLLQRGFYPALRRAGLRKIRFHDLRHTFASLMIANGEDIVRVSRMLGHASPNVTLNVYSHMLPKEHYGSSDRLVELIHGQSPRPVTQCA